jgi:hypothetical protein
VLYDVRLGVPVELETGKLNALWRMKYLRALGFLGREGSVKAWARNLELTESWVLDAGTSVIGKLMHYLSPRKFRQRSAICDSAGDLAANPLDSV